MTGNCSVVLGCTLHGEASPPYVEFSHCHPSRTLDVSECCHNGMEVQHAGQSHRVIATLKRPPQNVFGETLKDSRNYIRFRLVPIE